MIRPAPVPAPVPDPARARVPRVLLTVTLIASAAVARADARRVSVRVDPRVELFSILFRLADAEEYRQGFATPYRKAVDAHFAPFRTHPAVAATRRLRADHSIAFNAPVGLAVYLDGDTLRPIRALSPLPPGLDARWDGAPIDAYLQDVRDFVDKTGFRAFLAAQRPYTAEVEARFQAVLARHDAAAWLQKFFGAPPGATFTVVPGLLTGGSNYGATAVTADGKELLYQVVMLEDVDAGGLPRPTDVTVTLLVHETAHAFVNPVIERHAAAFATGAPQVFGHVKEGLAKQAYPSWKIMVIESCVRAATIAFARERLGEAATVDAMRTDEAASFLWIGELTDRVEALRRRRGAGRFDADVPAIAGFFRELATKYDKGLPRLPFRGPINAVFAPPRTSRLAFVAPSSGEVGAVARKIKERVAPAAAVYPADTADLGRLGGDKDPRSVIVYGTPQGSPLVAAALARFGWRVEAGRIALGDRAFDGEHLVLIAARPHPDSATEGILLYTAASEGDLVGINGVFHGPTDWVVGRRLPDGKYETVARGNFPKTRAGAWANP